MENKGLMVVGMIFVILLVIYAAAVYFLALR
jgi:hypothetical protein